MRKDKRIRRSRGVLISVRSTAGESSKWMRSVSEEPTKVSPL